MTSIDKVEPFVVAEVRAQTSLLQPVSFAES